MTILIAEDGLISRRMLAAKQSRARSEVLARCASIVANKVLQVGVAFVL